jgi:hypothetical protein
MVDRHPSLNVILLATKKVSQPGATRAGLEAAALHRGSLLEAG